MAVGTSVDRTDPQADWLWGLALTTAYKLPCGGWPHSVICSNLLWCFPRPPLGVVLLELIGWDPLAVWSWPLGVSFLGHLCRGSGAGQGWCWLWLARGYLLGATKRSSIGSCLCWTWRPHAKGYAVNWRWLPPVQGLGLLVERHRVPWGLLLPSSCP